MIFLLIGSLLGIAFGLAPGLHPNMIILFVPLFIILNIEPFSLLALIISMSVTNTLVDTIPSIMLGAPDSGNEMSVLPGHKMLLQGRGYEAVKLVVSGSITSVIICIMILPFLIIAVPAIYITIKPVIFALLIFILSIMILSEKKGKRVIALFCLIMSGMIGIMSDALPVSNTLILFPIFSGFFGVSVLLLQIKNRISVVEQTTEHENIPKKNIIKNAFAGSVGGIVSGFLPGVGSSEIASLASVSKNERSFLITMGSLTTSNNIFSLLSLWLIGKTRSGVAVAIDQVINVGFNEFIFIAIISVLSIGIAAISTIFLAKGFIKILRKINYSVISIFVIAAIIFMVFLFTGFYGLFIMAVCTSSGIFVNLAGIKRGTLMGVLIIPTLLFYIGI